MSFLPSPIKISQHGNITMIGTTGLFNIPVFVPVATSVVLHLGQSGGSNANGASGHQIRVRLNGQVGVNWTTVTAILGDIPVLPKTADFIIIEFYKAVLRSAIQFFSVDGNANQVISAVNVNKTVLIPAGKSTLDTTTNPLVTSSKIRLTSSTNVNVVQDVLGSTQFYVVEFK